MHSKSIYNLNVDSKRSVLFKMPIFVMLMTDIDLFAIK